MLPTQDKYIPFLTFILKLKLDKKGNTIATLKYSVQSKVSSGLVKVELEDKVKHRIDREKEWLVRISNLELLARSWIL